ncbi:MAG: hypothetical protein HZB14_09545 [Actinobacteria bacterium]|nr:hypothetical protein [Actinomycetota bacterium]
MRASVTARPRTRNLTLGLILTVVMAGLVLLLGAASSQAASNQLSAMQDDGRLENADPGIRDTALDEMQALGVDVVKLGAFWRRYAPNPESESRPSVDLTDPASYDWAQLAPAVDAVIARGMTPWIMISAPGPDWSTKKSTASTQEGVYLPDVKLFAQFAEAVGRKFPQVKILSIGNEPNFQYWMWPQMGKGLVSISGVHYRKTYIAAQKALVRAGHGDSTILFGGLAPRAFLPKVGQRATQPLRFLRDFFCLDEKLKPLKGRPAKLRSCSGRYSKIIASGFAYHPYTVAAGPGIRPTDRDDAPIAYLKRVYRVLDRAAALRRLSKRRIPLWNAEFAFQTNPPDINQSRLAAVPAFMNTSEYLTFADRRVMNYMQYQLFDEPLNTDFGLTDSKRYGGFQSGLRFADGEKKLEVYRAWQMPLMVLKGRGNRVTIWGTRRAVSDAPEVEIQYKDGSDWTTVATVPPIATAGYFKQSVSVAGANSKTWRLKSGDVYSRQAKSVKAPKASSK